MAQNRGKPEDYPDILYAQMSIPRLAVALKPSSIPQKRDINTYYRCEMDQLESGKRAEKGRLLHRNARPGRQNRGYATSSAREGKIISRLRLVAR